MGVQNSVIYVAMIMVQFAYAAANVLTKIALVKGLDQLVFVVYRHIIALLVLAPFAYILERDQRPPYSFLVMLKIFGLASLGTTIHMNVYYAGLACTSPTVASALSNVIPTFTFLMALLFGIEKVTLRSRISQAKVIGTLSSIGGSLIFTLWKGKYLFKGFKTPLLSILGYNELFRHGKENWIKGSCLILVSNIAWSAWLIFQVHVHTVYPAILSLNAWICFFAALQSSLIALFLSNNINVWRLEWNVQLLNIIYCGVVISAVVNFLQLWCINKRGPVFAAMFNPLQLVIVGFFSAIAFAERLHLGSLVGAFLIVIGLCSFLWGKNTEAKAQHRKSMAEMCRNPKFENGEEQQTKEKEIIEAASKDSISRIDAVSES
ncbi:WAT1-related protein At1g43650-like [Beta vulgaris subsp. vulgaris]|uniref:WAT1-related protein At1g43650-like n=1 Tax=Beta vulgaris subsp. vulgaris TaxID=3555 RepID=UPI00203724AF|nr:WAT1-related protein At1g43650-like [Beta vulgaris subsp. vulgaris]